MARDRTGANGLATCPLRVPPAAVIGASTDRYWSSSTVRAAEIGADVIRLARPDDAPRLDDVLADSFFDDPISIHLLPDASRRRDRLRLGMGHVMRSYIASNGAWTNDDLEGVALWAKPGDPKPSAMQQLK